MPNTRTPQKRERNRVGGTRRVASEQLKRKGQGSEVRALETFSSELPDSECGLLRGEPKEGRSRSFHRSPQGDTVLPSSPFPLAGPQAGWTPAGAPPLPLHYHSFCVGQSRVLSAQRSSSPFPHHSLPAWDPLLVPCELERSFAGLVLRSPAGAFCADPGSLATRSQKRKEGRTPPSSVRCEPWDVRQLVFHTLTMYSLKLHLKLYRLSLGTDEYSDGSLRFSLFKGLKLLFLW